MKNALKSMKCNHTSSARVVDGKLILSFPDAIMPVVWQMDFSQVKASALEVREGKEKGTYTLTLKTPKGEAMDVAPFAKREQAVAGLMAASRALENAHGRIHPADNSGQAGTQTATYTNTPQAKSGSGWAAPVGGVLLILVLMFFWSLFKLQPPSNMDQTSSQTQSSGAAPADDAGVPVPFNDFVKGR